MYSFKNGVTDFPNRCDEVMLVNLEAPSSAGLLLSQLSREGGCWASASVDGWSWTSGSGDRASFGWAAVALFTESSASSSSSSLTAVRSATALCLGGGGRADSVWVDVLERSMANGKVRGAWRKQTDK